MKYAILVCLVALCFPAAAQISDPGGPIQIDAFPQLSSYLQLTGEQTLTLVKINGEWNQYLTQKRVRVSQVNRELDEVAKQDTLDPMAFGVRYAELESICREAKDRRSQYRQKTRDMLTATQTQKLQILEQAFSLSPVILEAHDSNMMGHEIKITDPRPGLSSGTGLWGINPNYVDLLPGCRPPTITPIILPMPFPQP